MNKDMEFYVDEYVNNFGYIDKDRRFERKDNSVRIMLLGGCWLEGMQTTIDQHTNIFLESMLRRQTGVNFEVISQAGPSTTIGQNAVILERYGKLFGADILLAFQTQVDLFMFEPVLNEKHTGMIVGHAQKSTFDFDEQGNIILVPGDPGYAAFRQQPDKSPILGTVSQTATGFATAAWPPSYVKATQLLKGVLKEKIIDQVKDTDTKVGLIFGYHANSGVTYGRGQDKNGLLAKERWFHFLEGLCKDLDIYPLNLASPMMDRSIIQWRSWNKNWHPSPYGHYMIAKSVAEKLMAWPDFKEIVTRQKQKDQEKNH